MPERSFVGIDLSDACKQSLSVAVERLKESTIGIRWVKQELLHITLEFIGPLPENNIDVFCSALKQSLATTKPFTISFGAVQGFPSLSKCRILWVGIHEGNEELGCLSRSVRRELSQLSLKPGRASEPYTPHLTVGRAIGNEFVNFVIDEKFSFMNLPKELIKEITLFQSVLTESGPIYTPLVKFPL